MKKNEPPRAVVRGSGDDGGDRVRGRAGHPVSAPLVPAPVMRWVITYRHRGRTERKEFKDETQARKWYANICQRGFPAWATLQEVTQ